MASSINASTSGAGGVITTADNTGILNIQTASTTALTIDASQRAAFVAGTAALPAITTTGDTNTGIWFPAADTIAFAEGGAEAMRLDSSGNVGIGTTSPAGKLDVAGDMYVNNLASSPTGGIYLGQSGYRASILWNVSTGNLDITPRSGFGTVFTAGNVLVNTTTSNGRLTVHAASGQAPSYFRVFTNGDAGTFYANASGTIVGQVTVNSSSTAYVTSSDYRLKENIAPMTGALDKVSALKPVTYTWKADGSDGQGFIAHELAEVIPDCVSGEKDAVNEDGSIKAQGVDTSFLVATLTAAIQEQQTLIVSQSELITNLTARVTALEAK